MRYIIEKNLNAKLTRHASQRQQTLQRQELGHRSTSRTSQTVQIVIHNRDREAQRRHQDPEDPKISRDQYLPALGIEVEELRAKHRLLHS